MPTTLPFKRIMMTAGAINYVPAGTETIPGTARSASYSGLTVISCSANTENSVAVPNLVYSQPQGVGAMFVGSGSEGNFAIFPGGIGDFAVYSHPTEYDTSLEVGYRGISYPPKTWKKLIRPNHAGYGVGTMNIGDAFMVGADDVDFPKTQFVLFSANRAHHVWWFSTSSIGFDTHSSDYQRTSSCYKLGTEEPVIDTTYISASWGFVIPSGSYTPTGLGGVESIYARVPIENNASAADIAYQMEIANSGSYHMRGRLQCERHKTSSASPDSVDSQSIFFINDSLGGTAQITGTYFTESVSESMVSLGPNALIGQTIISASGFSNLILSGTTSSGNYGQKTAYRGRASQSLASARLALDPDDDTSFMITGSSADAKLYLSSSGRVGIGTDDPQQYLDIQGNIGSKGLSVSASRLGTAIVDRDFVVGEALAVAGKIETTEGLQIGRGDSKALEFKFVEDHRGSQYDTVEISSSLDKLGFGPATEFGSDVTMSSNVSVAGELSVTTLSPSSGILALSGEITASQLDSANIIIRHDGIGNWPVEDGESYIGPALYVDGDISASGIIYTNRLVGNDSVSSGSLIVSGSLTLKDNVINPKVSSSTLYDKGGHLYYGGGLLQAASGFHLSASADGDVGYIKVLHHDWICDDGNNYYNIAVEKTGGTYMLKANSVSLDMYAFVDIPYGWLATAVGIWGQDADTNGTVAFYEYDMTDGSRGSAISTTPATYELGTGGEAVLDTIIEGTATNALMIVVNPDDSTDGIYGAYVKIERRPNI